uniref:Uncharacterized protein n=1 Tax=Aplanochytrium stocchinoi TaxID=215587 RepID=A0A7S3V1D5_9STRA
MKQGAVESFTTDWLGLFQMAAYFAILIASFVTIIKLTPIWSGIKLARANRHGTVYFPVCCLLVQSVLSLLYTWYYIFKFVVEDIARFETFDEWLEKGEMFFNAYVMVAGSEGRWVWTSGLLFWVLIGVSYMTYESKRLKIRYTWAYVVVGFLGAISVSFTLFYSHVLIKEYLIVVHNSESVGKAKSENEKKGTGANAKDSINLPLLLVVCVIGGFAATVKMPLSLQVGNKLEFNICLLIVHGILFAPAVFCAPTFQSALENNSASYGRPLSSGLLNYLKILSLFCCLAYYVYVFSFYKKYINLEDLSAGFDFFNATRDLIGEISLNSCQISITADLFSTTLATMVLITSETDSLRNQILFIFGCILCSPAVATGIYLIHRETFPAIERAYLIPAVKKQN